MAEPLLCVDNLEVLLPAERGRVKPVDGVTLRLGSGESMGLVGESGCGKSMLARSIMGLLPLKAGVEQRGTIRFQGQDLNTLPNRERQRITGSKLAMIFQDPVTSLNPVMKIGRQVEEVLRLHLKIDRKTAHARAVERLRQVGIPMPEKRAEHYPHQLSGGLCQRVAIAMALACGPKLLIADEPTTALDATVQIDILNLMDRLRKADHMAMLLITHDLGVAAGRTGTTAVMYAGRIVEQAPTESLFSHARMPYTRALVDAIPRLTDPPHKELKAIDGQPPDLSEAPAGCRFAPRCPRADARCLSQEPPLEGGEDPLHLFACWNPL